jgi:hypothetical protein
MDARKVHLSLVLPVLLPQNGFHWICEALHFADSSSTHETKVGNESCFRAGQEMVLDLEESHRDVEIIQENDSRRCSPGGKKLRI